MSAVISDRSNINVSCYLAQKTKAAMFDCSCLQNTWTRLHFWHTSTLF